MNTPEIGSKYVIEIEEVYVTSSTDGNPQRLYRMKGFNSLVFDEEGLKKLIPFEQYKLQLLTDIMGHFTKEK